MSHPTGGPPQGFGLLELSVSLVIGGMAVAGAAALLLQLGSVANAIRATSLEVDREANAERMLRLLTRNADPAADTIGLRGDRQNVVFRTWCETTSGWSEPCRVRIAFRTLGESASLSLERLDASPDGAGNRIGETETVLWSGTRAGRFLYLLDAAGRGTWSEAWSATPFPAAIAVVLETDTLILPVR